MAPGLAIKTLSAPYVVGYSEVPYPVPIPTIFSWRRSLLLLPHLHWTSDVNFNNKSIIHTSKLTSSTMGVNVILTKIWSGAASKTHPVGRKFSPSESIRYHLVAFRHLSTINAELIYHTYANGPSIAIIGIIPDRNVENELCAIHGTFLSQAPTLCQYGERSVWTDKANDITV